MAVIDRVLIWSKLITIVILVIFYRFQTGDPIRIYPKSFNKTIYIDPHFSTHEKNDILLAAIEWNYATKNVIKFNIMTSKDLNDLGEDSIRIIKVTENDHLIEETDFIDKNKILGYYFPADKNPYIAIVSERLDDSNFKSVVLHELGHAIGLKHICGKEGVFTLMYPYINLGSDRITPDDVDHVCELYDCSANK